MRPRIIDYFNQRFSTSLFDWIIPDPAFVYAVMIGIGTWIFVRRCKSDSLSSYHALGIILWGVAGGLIGARLFFLIQNAGDVIQHPKILMELNGGTASFGAYLGGLMGMAFYFVRHKLAPFPYLDVLASTMGIGPFIGRMACFLNGDDFGKPTTVAWGVRYPHGSMPFSFQAIKGWIDPRMELSLPVHPVQLYGSLKGLLLFLVFTWLWKKKPFMPGGLFLLYWMCYAVLRYILEFFRGDEDRGWVGPLSTGQFMSLIFFAVSLILSLLRNWDFPIRRTSPSR